MNGCPAFIATMAMIHFISAALSPDLVASLSMVVFNSAGKDFARTGALQAVPASPRRHPHVGTEEGGQGGYVKNINALRCRRGGSLSLLTCIDLGFRAERPT
jgi:hypothetical protein